MVSCSYCVYQSCLILNKCLNNTKHWHMGKTYIHIYVLMYVYNFLCIIFCYMYICMSVYHIHVEARKRVSYLLDCSYRWSWAATWFLWFLEFNWFGDNLIVFSSNMSYFYKYFYKMSISKSAPKLTAAITSHNVYMLYPYLLK